MGIPAAPPLRPQRRREVRTPLLVDPVPEVPEEALELGMVVSDPAQEAVRDAGEESNKQALVGEETERRWNGVLAVGITAGVALIVAFACCKNSCSARQWQLGPRDM
uniref:Uncharacterized protein n=1 Tax=Aegilops tauschii TaxID=37682 RepID=M8C8L2_AEGTA